MRAEGVLIRAPDRCVISWSITSPSVPEAHRTSFAWAICFSRTFAPKPRHSMPGLSSHGCGSARQELGAMSGGSFNTVEMNPAECGFRVCPAAALPIAQTIPTRSKRTESDTAIRHRPRRHRADGLRRTSVHARTGRLADRHAIEQETHLAVRRRRSVSASRAGRVEGAEPAQAFRQTIRHPKRKIALLPRRDLNRPIWSSPTTPRWSSDLRMSGTRDVMQFDRSFVTSEILVERFGCRSTIRTDPSPPLRLICAGRQIRIKGTDQVIRAVAKLREMNVPVELNVMGDGDDLPAFKQLASELNLTDIVHFTGTVPYGPPCLTNGRRSDIMLVTNLTAEISRNVLLTLARGLPLVTYENPAPMRCFARTAPQRSCQREMSRRWPMTIAQLNRDRAKLVELAENGLKLASNKTLQATHQKRAELAAKLLLSSAVEGCAFSTNRNLLISTHRDVAEASAHMIRCGLPSSCPSPAPPVAHVWSPPTRIVCTSADTGRRRLDTEARPGVRREIRSLLKGNGWPKLHGPSHFDHVDVDHRDDRSISPDHRRRCSRCRRGDRDVVGDRRVGREIVAGKGVKAYFIQHDETQLSDQKDRVIATWALPMHKITIAQWLVDLGKSALPKRSRLSWCPMRSTWISSTPRRAESSTIRPSA